MKDNKRKGKFTKLLSICVELIKNDVNLKFRLNVSSKVIYRRRFQNVEY